jgi:hypothetical protein
VSSTGGGDSGVPTTGTEDPTTPTTSTTTTDPTTGEGTDTGEPAPCEAPAPMCNEPVDSCKADQDHDGVTFACDNAPQHSNPEQLDMDKDGFGDVSDLCPTVPSAENVGDEDRDGVGNGCDLCARKPSFFNKNAADVPAFMRVRNVPLQGDADRDGIGDACDNCVWAPNCQGFGDSDGLVPFKVGSPIDIEADDCQVDLDEDLVGDACAGTVRPGAAGPVGLGDDDDFDQDGLINVLDVCPRQPVAPQACASASDCPAGASCTSGTCNHTDQDNDGVGDICDTCPHAANPKQVAEGGAQEDDPDGDFIGTACEGNLDCTERPNPRPFAFYDASAGGLCCVAVAADAVLVDPSGQPVDPGGLPLPPGVLQLPPGCSAPARELGACDVDALPDLWDHLCLLPSRDQDVDTIPDACDLCMWAFDPTNEIFVDDEGMSWPDFGKFCQGEFSPETLDPANMCLPAAL